MKFVCVVLAWSFVRSNLLGGSPAFQEPRPPAKPRKWRSILALGVAALLYAAVAASARAQTPVPEFYGFYAIDGSQMIALYEGRNSGDTAKTSQAIYSVPNNGPQTWTLAVLPTSTRFVLFYANSGDMVKTMTFHRLPQLRKVVETPDSSQQQLAAASGHIAEPRVLSTPNTPLLVRIPELQSRILTKPVPDQPQMVELAPDTQLVPGLYVFDYSSATNPGWYLVVSIVSASEPAKPFCLDLYLPGGFGGNFERANSELNDAVPALASNRYKRCNTSAASTASGKSASSSSGATVSAATCGDYDPCLQAGFAAYKSRDWNAATAAFNAAAAKRPTSGDPWLWLGRILLMQDDPVQLQDLASVWDRALKLGATLKLGACHEHGLKPCDRGDLVISTNSVSFLANGTVAAFSASPSGVTPGRILDNSPGAHISYGMRVDGKNYNIDLIPTGAICDFSVVVHCPPESIAKQLTLTQYVSQTLPKLASGSMAPTSAPTKESPPTDQQ